MKPTPAIQFQNVTHTFFSKEEEVTAILISGMLTSELGLCFLPHLEAPVGLRQLHDGMRRQDVGISSSPCYFVPGIKQISNEPCQWDVMRGEECEFFGLTDQTKPGTAYILPGSHTKHIFSSKPGQITSFRTFLTGEMLAALSQGTILSGSVDLRIEDFDEDFLLLGYDHSRDYGINRVLFQTRILDTQLKKGPREIYSYFLGAVLYGDVSTLDDYQGAIYVGGKRQLRESILYLLRHRTSLCATAIPEDTAELAATRGIIRIFEYQGE